jgi:hypothetical protein
MQYSVLINKEKEVMIYGKQIRSIYIYILFKVIKVNKVEPKIVKQCSHKMRGRGKKEALVI